MILTALSAWAGVSLLKGKTGLWISLGCAAAALVLHLVARGKGRVLYGISIAINAVGAGAAVSAYYLSRPAALTPETVVGALLAAWTVWIFSGVLLLFLKGRGLSALLFFGSFAAAAALWIIRKTPLYSFWTFLLLWLSFFWLAGALFDPGEEGGVQPVRAASMAGFGGYMAVAALVLILLSADGCDGDCCDGDCCSFDRKKKGKQSP